MDSRLCRGPERRLPRLVPLPQRLSSGELPAHRFIRLVAKHSGEAYEYFWNGVGRHTILRVPHFFRLELFEPISCETVTGALP